MMRKRVKRREKTIHLKMPLVIKLIKITRAHRTIILVLKYLTKLVNLWTRLCGWVSLMMNKNSRPLQDSITEFIFEGIAYVTLVNSKQQNKYLKIISKPICMIICATSYFK